MTVTDRQQIVVTITERLHEVIPDLQPAELTEGRNLREFPSFDSLGILETLVWLETTFAVTIPDEELVVDRFDSVAKMADYVVTHRG
jgi:acyl carrier protein